MVNVGQSYASVAWSQELTPLVQGTLSVIGNINDQSTMLSPSLSISVSDNTQKRLLEDSWVWRGSRRCCVVRFDGRHTDSQQRLDFSKMFFAQMRSYF